MPQQTADTVVARRGHMWGLMIPYCMQSAPLTAVQSKTYSTISSKQLQLRRYTSAFKLKSNCNLPASSIHCPWARSAPCRPSAQHCTSLCKNTIFVCRPYPHFLTNPPNAQKSGLNSTSWDITVEKVIKYLDSFDSRKKLLRGQF